jgi:hypothetical protein
MSSTFQANTTTAQNSGDRYNRIVRLLPSGRPPDDSAVIAA